MSQQRVSLGQLQAEFQDELEVYGRERIVQRLWAKDATLWPKEFTDGDSALTQLEWLFLPRDLRRSLEFVEKSFASADAEGLVEHALLTSESLNLSARALLNLPGIAPQRKLAIFDSADPEAIQENEQQLHLKRTLFVLANKSQYGLKDHCLFLYLRERLRGIGATDISRQFVSETQPQSYLATLTREYSFRETHPEITMVPANYCGLTQFGPLLIAMGFSSVDEILDATRRIQASCSISDPQRDNPALQLAALFSGAVRAQRPYVALLVPVPLIPYARRLAQLLGGSLAQGASGLFPIIWTLASPTIGFYGRAVFVVVTWRSDPPEITEQAIDELVSRQEPLLHIRLEQPSGLLTDTFTWEAATILASARLGLNPFQAPDNRMPQTFAVEMLEQLLQGRYPFQRSPRITSSLLQLYADGNTRSEISMLSLVEALRSFLRIPTPAEHITLLVEIRRTEELHERFVFLRNLLSVTLRRPVLIAFGPGSGEYAGHFFRHTLRHGLSLFFTTDSPFDKAIPGAHYSFGQLQQAMALSEYDTLVHSRRPAVRFHLGLPLPAALGELQQVFREALHRFQP